jgi:hypothetical protein
MSQSSASATLSGKVGPALTVTAAALPNVQLLTLDFRASVGHIEWYAVGGKPRTLDFDLILTTTLTDTITSLVNVLVVAGT